MGAGYSRVDLNGWARSVGASNDEEAIAALRQIALVLRDAIDGLLHARRLADQADDMSDLHDQVWDAWVAASQAVRIADHVRQAFARHERGND